MLAYPAAQVPPPFLGEADPRIVVGSSKRIEKLQIDANADRCGLEALKASVLRGARYPVAGSVNPTILVSL